MKLLLLGIASLVCFSACRNAANNNPHYIKVGVEAGPEFIVAEAAQKVAKEKYGLTVELVAFNDYIMPNTALAQGDIDLNVFQTRPFLEEQSTQRGYHFAIVGETFIFPMAAYSRKIKTKDELAEGSTLVIPNDATNEGRALLLLENAGLLKLKPGRGYAPRLIDIAENPLKLNILELEAPQLPRALDDKQVSLAVINNNFAVKANLFLQDGVIVEDKDSPYVNLIVAREDNSQEEKVKQFVASYQSEEVWAVAEKEFPGGVVRGNW
ncbi:MAG: MetQ/NlpA family lipoprotein [Tannerellaceae bacterium]|jgi:D-methionine transport system substrate-binding protein|nr:MetQ/NlpA family lipoprotein [Tannerellaceae bacterium]